MAERRTRRPVSRSLRAGGLLAVTAAFCAGLAVVALGEWRIGLWVCAAALGLGAVVRLVAPARAVGLLRVRHRAVDVLLLAGGAVAIAVLAWSR
ncbi:DUF3017 domain-containing protein [Auraticoccus monumenti]|uniref:DUF3017 domain-containing protein n=1 Tax=Auraticoccus monumenti TaxID=675864 RepID=A0A1G6XNV5_9ACTN|nr:DUF3017 domain-containing protein [Auraticoccus monumenti]SDD79874.1 Protein of unknown function [Auraticoccus monumenti]